MARLPVAGAVKSRLARAIGTTQATRFYRNAVSTTIARLAGQPFWQTIVAVTPDWAIADRTWPRGVSVMAQGPGDLGARMQRLLERQRPGPVVVIGTDIPGIQVQDVRRAFYILGRKNVVFGPAQDGGFWLVGLRRRPRPVQLFKGVRWSAPSTLVQTRANIAEGKVGIASTLRDVDHACDLAAHHRILGRRILPARR